MTKLEAEYIKLVIDRYTTRHDGGPYGGDYSELSERGISKVKEEIDKLVKED